MQAGKREERVRQVTVNILGWLKYRSVFFHSEIQLEKAEVEDPAVVDERHEANDGDNERQRIEREVHGA